jgi:hypothetical protein
MRRNIRNARWKSKKFSKKRNEGIRLIRGIERS